MKWLILLEEASELNEGELDEVGRFGMAWWGEVGSDDRGLGIEMGDGIDCLGDDRETGDDCLGDDRETGGDRIDCLGDERGLDRGTEGDCLGDDRGLDWETGGRIESCLGGEQLFSSSSSISSTKSREDIGIAKGDWETCLSRRWSEGGGPSCEGISCEGGKEGKIDIIEDLRIEDIRILSFKRDE